MNDILQRLGLFDENPGTWLGSNSLEDASAALIESVNPANGEVIASVRSTTTSGQSLGSASDPRSRAWALPATP